MDPLIASILQNREAISRAAERLSRADSEAPAPAASELREKLRRLHAEVGGRAAALSAEDAAALLNLSREILWGVYDRAKTDMWVYARENRAALARLGAEYAWGLLGRAL